MRVARRLVLHEGRYHQVRRMFAATARPTCRPCTAVVGGLDLQGLDEGQWRQLTSTDLDTLFAP